MDQIYGSAEEVIVWVGQEDEFTTDAMCAIETIGNIPQERHAETQAKDWFEQDSVLARVGAQPLYWKKWLEMVVFLGRPLFQRMWTVQEIILAKVVTVICGDKRLPWDLISKTVSFLITTQWDYYLTVSYVSTVLGALTVPGIYKKVMEAKILFFSPPLMYMEHIRTSVEKVGHAMPFRYLLRTFRLSEASDLRDKIYALLSLAWKERPPLSTYPDVLIPDYTISARALYVKTTRLMLQSHADLRILADVEDETYRKMQDLPSWVPDFSAAGIPTPLDTRLGVPVYKASKGLEYTTDTVDYYEETLVVAGFRLSVVKDAADRFPPGVYEEKAGELDDHFIQIFQFAADISETQMMTISPSTTRVEILWRTLCGDVLANELSPAPSDAKEEFFRWLCFWIMARTYVAEEVQNIRQLEGQKRWERFFQPILQLLEQEPDTSIFHLDHFQNEFGEAVTTEDNYMNFERVRDTFNRWWVGVLKHHSGSRRHFQDIERRYRMGPSSGDIGDEIWVIAGMMAPYLLRQVETGKYKYLGEVYIYGILNGELADHNLLKPVSTITMV